MLRGISVLLCAAAMFASIRGCVPQSPPSQQQPEVPAPATYYNGYLGLTVTVPSGWHEEEISPYNLTENPRDSADLYSLDLYDYQDGGYSIDLITIQNGFDSSADDHAEMMLYADYYPGTGEDEYLGWITDYILDKTDNEYFYRLEDISPQNLNGRRYTRFLVQVSLWDGSPPYYEEYYVSPVNGTFFVAYVNYWSDSDQSRDAAYSALENAFLLEQDYGSSPDGPMQWI